jgi:hypothetical protein
VFKEPDCQFLAQAILRQIREHIWPTGKEAQIIMKLPLIASLRNQLTQGDAEVCLKVVEERDDATSAFAALLLRPFCVESTVQRRLLVRWNSASPELRCHLVWRILDDPCLSASKHRELLEYILENWEVWKSTLNNFFHSDPGDVLGKVEARLADGSTPESKKWVYLCGLPEFASNQHASRDLIERFAEQTGDRFNREVCFRLVRQFWPKYGAAESKPPLM